MAARNSPPDALSELLVTISDPVTRGTLYVLLEEPSALTIKEIAQTLHTSIDTSHSRSELTALIRHQAAPKLDRHSFITVTDSSLELDHSEFSNKELIPKIKRFDPIYQNTTSRLEK